MILRSDSDTASVRSSAAGEKSPEPGVAGVVYTHANARSSPDGHSPVLGFSSPLGAAPAQSSDTFAFLITSAKRVDSLLMKVANCSGVAGNSS